MDKKEQEWLLNVQIKYINGTFYDGYLQSEIEYVNEELVKAFCQQYFEAAKWLLSVGGSIHTSDDQPFRFSCMKNIKKSAEMLYEMGANIHARNENALFWACSKGHLDMVKWLVSIGANVHANDNAAYYVAIKKDRINIINWLLDNFEKSALEKRENYNLLPDDLVK